MSEAPNERPLFRGSLWDSEFCKRADDMRAENPEEFKTKDKMTAKFVDCVNFDEVKKRHLERIDLLMKEVVDYSLSDSEISEKNLKLLVIEYGENWREQLPVRVPSIKEDEEE